jgi:hypothetical protein
MIREIANTVFEAVAIATFCGVLLCLAFISIGLVQF